MTSLFSKPKVPTTTPLPPVAEPVALPERDDESILEAKKKKYIRQRQRSGRQSTMLTMRADAQRTSRLGG